MSCHSPSVTMLICKLTLWLAHKKLKNFGLKSSMFVPVGLDRSLGNLNYRFVTCWASDKFTPINSITNSLTNTEMVMICDKILTHALFSWNME